MGALSGQLCRCSREGISLTVRLTPKSSRDEISGVDLIDGTAMLKARVRAVPAKGQANRALTKLIAKWLRVPASSVALSRGGKSRAKSIAVHGDPDELERLVESRLAALESVSEIRGENG